MDGGGETIIDAVLSLTEDYGVSIALGVSGEFNDTHVWDLYSVLVENRDRGLFEALKLDRLSRKQISRICKISILSCRHRIVRDNLLTCIISLWSITAHLQCLVLC